MDVVVRQFCEVHRKTLKKTCLHKTHLYSRLVALTMREERRLRVFENRVMRRIPGYS